MQLMYSDKASLIFNTMGVNAALFSVSIQIFIWVVLHLYKKRNFIIFLFRYSKNRFSILKLK